MQLQKLKWTLKSEKTLRDIFNCMEIVTSSVKFINNNYYLKISSYFYEN